MNIPRLITHRDGLIFIDKPTGWASHRSAEGGPDVVGWLNQSKLTRGARPVHRLDAETSGVLLCAHQKARAMASSWFAERRVEKIYRALVYGTMHATGTITTPLDDREAETEVSLEEVFTVNGQPLSLITLTPRTGRKHQIRRHLHQIRHPVLGDRRYSRARLSLPVGAPDRLWLHAASLIVPERVPILAPLPAELEAHLQALRGGVSD